MAELPDLTVFSHILSRRFKSKCLTELSITETRKLNVRDETLKSSLEGKKLIDVSREGKTLQLHFAENIVLGIHLMLRGELVGLENGETPRFQILAFHFDNGDGFAVIDLQKQATATLQPKSVNVPDALNLERSYFEKLLAKKSTVIKTLLMDQKSMRGIGNSYADEILYHAGVSPFSIAKEIPPKQVTQIFKSIQTVIEKAIKDIGDANGDELRGELKDFMAVHSSSLKITAKGEAIKTEKIGGRNTYYTDTQELFG